MLNHESLFIQQRLAYGAKASPSFEREGWIFGGPQTNRSIQLLRLLQQ
jgi:hypothetical protein